MMSTIEHIEKLTEELMRRGEHVSPVFTVSADLVVDFLATASTGLYTSPNTRINIIVYTMFGEATLNIITDKEQYCANDGRTLLDIYAEDALLGDLDG